MDSVTIIRLVAGVLFLAVLALFVAYIVTLSKTLDKCSPSVRSMQPGMMWLLVIPFFGLIWNFLVVNAIAESLKNEFRLRAIQTLERDPGKSIGLAMCICGACSLIPLLGVLTAIPYIVLWIMYWVKVSSFSKMLDQTPAVIAPQGTTSF